MVGVYSGIRSDEELTLEMSAFESLWLIYIINADDKTKFSCSTTELHETRGQLGHREKPWEQGWEI